MRRRNVALRDFFWMTRGGGQSEVREHKTPPFVVVVVILNSQKCEQTEAR
jgi:hypothetical protein